jgi:putative hydrolase of the HAD superfamily
MPTARAVLFDFGGTLYDYQTLEQANRESLLALARWAGIEAEADLIQRVYRDAMRRVFYDYLPRPYYLHRDLFLDALIAMLEDFGVGLEPAHFERYRARLREGQRRDLALRKGVVETLRALRERGLSLGLVSTIDEDQLADLVEAGGLSPHFDWQLSSEAAGSCKPHPAIFEQALRRVGCAAGETLFVGDMLKQDIAGANRAEMCSVLLWHRDDCLPPADGPQPHHVIRHIPEVLDLLG